MAHEEGPEIDQVSQSVERAKFDEEQSNETNVAGVSGGGGECLNVSCFTETVDDVVFHFQIIRFPRQIYLWVGCGSSKFGNLYAATSTGPNNTVCNASLLGGACDNTGSGMARRLVMKTGLNIILACNIPLNNPIIEASAERILVKKLTALGYTKGRI